jgi:hypothetical protein
MQRTLIKKRFLIRVGSVCRVKTFTAGLRRSKVADDNRPGRPGAEVSETKKKTKKTDILRVSWQSNGTSVVNVGGGYAEK